VNTIEELAAEVRELRVSINESVAAFPLI